MSNRRNVFSFVSEKLELSLNLRLEKLSEYKPVPDNDNCIGSGKAVFGDGISC